MNRQPQLARAVVEAVLVAAAAQRAPLNAERAIAGPEDHVGLVELGLLRQAWIPDERRDHFRRDEGRGRQRRQKGRFWILGPKLFSEISLENL